MARHSRLCIALLAGLLVCGGAVALCAGFAGQAAAQAYGLRVVSGTVLDDSGKAQAGATVFLKNLKTKSIRSFTTGADGNFRFAQVNMTDDQEVWAEFSGKKSAVKTVSSWDTRKQFECELKLK
jgi:hypothetical protein